MVGKRDSIMDDLMVVQTAEKSAEELKLKLS